MDPKEIRQLLGLPENATDEAVREAIKTKNAGPAEGDPPSDPPQEPGDPEPTTEEDDPKPEGEPAESTDKELQQMAASKGMTLVDKATLDHLRAGAEAGLESKKERDKADRDREIAAALEVGKIMPSRKEHYEKSWDADPEGTRQLLASLEPGLVPVAQRTSAGKDAGEAGTGGDAYPDRWFPEVAARKSGRQSSRITMEVK